MSETARRQSIMKAFRRVDFSHVREALHLMRSMIASGEDWSSSSQERYERAMSALQTMADALEGEGNFWTAISRAEAAEARVAELEAALEKVAYVTFDPMAHRDNTVILTDLRALAERTIRVLPLEDKP